MPDQPLDHLRHVLRYRLLAFEAELAHLPRSVIAALREASENDVAER